MTFTHCLCHQPPSPTGYVANDILLHLPYLFYAIEAFKIFISERVNDIIGSVNIKVWELNIYKK